MKYLLSAAAVTAGLFFGLSAHAFEILTPLSDGCHERITLGAFDSDGEFDDAEDVSLQGLLSAMVDRARSEGIPSDDGSRGAVRHVAEAYGFDHEDEATKYVLASLIIGVRDPDTRGFSVVRLNVTRTTHVIDALQEEHSLRHIADDGQEGNGAAIDSTKARLAHLVEIVHAGWWDGSDQTMEARWTLPHYGEITVRVFAPAFRLGTIVHTLQDGYTHMLRDEDGLVVHVLNFVEASTDGVVESRDGLAHSKRLDTCDIGSDSFDRQRVGLARTASVEALATVETMLEQETFAIGGFEAAVADIYTLRAGCDLSNKYCDNGWVDAARTEQTEPVDIGFPGCTTAKPTQRVPGSPWFVAALGALLLASRRVR